MTVLEVIQKSAEFLEKKGVDSPRLQVELLLAHVLKVPRMKLYLNFERKLSEAEMDHLRAAVVRRGNREPLQHIVGSTSFCGLEITVSRDVLVPRPETELLAEAGWKFLASVQDSIPKALDFATGSGCVAIAVAHHVKHAQLLALDVSPAALKIADGNVQTHGLSDRIRFLQSNAFSMLEKSEKFHLIISNPPYIPAPEIATLDPEVQKFDPHLALDGGLDGLEFYRVLAKEAPAYLLPQGQLMAEFGDGQANDIREIFETAGWTVQAVEKDYTGRERFFVAVLG